MITSRELRVASGLHTPLGVIIVPRGLARLSVDDDGVTVRLVPAVAGLVDQLATRRSWRDYWVPTVDRSAEEGWFVAWREIPEIRVSGRRSRAAVIARRRGSCRVVFPSKAAAEAFHAEASQRGVPIRRVRSTFNEQFTGLQG